MKRRLSDLVAYAEIISSIAILVSLAFLVIQISDNTRHVRAASAHDASALLQSWYQDVGRDPVASDIWRRGIMDISSLKREEQFQFIMIFHAAMLAYQSAFFLGQEGALDRALATTLTETMTSVKGRPGYEFYWSQRQAVFSQDFRDFMDGLEASNNVPAGAIYDPE